MPTKVTIQDIADSLGLSRTTVSKVLNHSTAVSEATRTLVLNKARELNYRMLPTTPRTPAPVAAEQEMNYFALVMRTVPSSFHMGTAVIFSLDQKMRQAGYSMITCAITNEEYKTMTLPHILTSPQIKAIVCIELFSPEYSQLLSSLGKPMIFIDACVGFQSMGLNADLLLMDSRNSVNRMLNTLIHNHKISTMGFVGDVDHCTSFRERYEAFLLSAKEHGVDTSLSILDDDCHYSEPDWLSKRLAKMKNLPRLFFCANDYLAGQVMYTLESMGKRIPEDVMVCGFDGQPTMEYVFSRMTTVITPSEQIGAYAATLLLHKLQFGSSTNVSSYVNTKIVFRNSAPEF